MSTRWELLAGNTSVFAVRMGFHADESAICLAPDFAASWGSLEIWVNGINLCAHVEEGETLDAVHWYLLPLLEWIAGAWNAFLHEERLPVRNAGMDAIESLYRTRFPPPGSDSRSARRHDEAWYAWRERHALHAARDGGLFPEVFLRRLGDRIEISWSDQAPAGAPEDYAFLVPQGRALLDPDDVARPLFLVLRDAVAQLRGWVPDSGRLSDLLRATTELNKPEKQRTSRLDWLFDIRVEGSGTSHSWGAVKRLFNTTSAAVREAVLIPTGSGLVLRGSSHAVLLFGSVSPTVSADDAHNLARLLIDLFDEDGDPSQLTSLVDAASLSSGEGLPWEQGYDLAEQAHQALDEDGGGWVQIETVLSALGVLVAPVALTDERIRGVAVAGPQHRPAICPNESHPRNKRDEGRRFTLAHELCHLLVDRQAGRKLAVASGPWAPIDVEKRANAFAAAFLMPPDRVSVEIARLTEPVHSPGAVRTLAEAFRTSQSATVEHLHNLGWLDEFERDTLRGSG
jgi:Zn-dependent peptidase ImmA (M78 family)